MVVAAGARSALTSTPPSERLAYRIVSVLAALIALVLLIVLVLPSAGALMDSMGASRWERTEGRVVSHTAQRSGGFIIGSGEQSEITVEYRAEGQTHTARAFLELGGRKADERVAQLNERGVVVRYPPGRAAEGVVEGEGIDTGGGVLGFILGVVFAVIAAYGARRLWRESHHARATR